MIFPGSILNWQIDVDTI